MKGKKAAIELSMTTIVVVVLSLTLLIMGFVLVRSIMCGSINLVEDIDKLSKNEVNKLFGSTSGEISCYGMGGIKSVYTGNPARTNEIGCRIKAPATANYKFSLEINEKYSTISKEEIKEWLKEGDEWEVSPGDENAKPIGELIIPNDAPAGDIALDMKVLKDGKDFKEERLKFAVNRVGVITNTIC